MNKDNRPALYCQPSKEKERMYIQKRVAPLEKTPVAPAHNKVDNESHVPKTRLGKIALFLTGLALLAGFGYGIYSTISGIIKFIIGLFN